MDAAQKEAYLREYEVMKKKGKPFFPYAVMKDSVMALIVVLVIATMSIFLGAEQGPKADPTTTTSQPALLPLNQALRRLGPGRNGRPTVHGEETHPNYNRVLLSTVVAGTMTQESTRLHDDRWAEEHRVDLRLGRTASERSPRTSGFHDGRWTCRA